MDLPLGDSLSPSALLHLQLGLEAMCATRHPSQLAASSCFAIGQFPYDLKDILVGTAAKR